MGLLEYQAMPSLRDVAHDGVLCFSNTCRSDLDRDTWCDPSGRAAWTVHHTQTGSLLTDSYSDRRVWRALYIAFGLIEVVAQDQADQCWNFRTIYGG
jgi:hypothetical protein